MPSAVSNDGLSRVVRVLFYGPFIGAETLLRFASATKLRSALLLATSELTVDGRQWTLHDGCCLLE